MTGFGRSELKSEQGLIRVEIKTVNHKFLEVSTRLPGHLSEHEDLLRKTIGDQIRRGKVNVFVACPDPAVFAAKLHLNESLAREVFHKVRQLQKMLGLGRGDDASLLREILHYPDVLTKEVSSDGGRVLAGILEKALRSALESLRRSRLREGHALENDFRLRLREIRKSLSLIERRIPVLHRQYRKSLQGRMKEFLKNGELDHERLTLEVALYVKNSDISEEVTRLKAHLDAVARTLAEGGELGRKIDFIAQEMTREANTMGAKSSDAAIAENVIRIKGAIEKVREQAQNVE